MNSALFTFFLFVLMIFGLVTLARAARIVKQAEKGLVMRLGKYHAMVDPGLTFLMPWVDSIIRVDMRERVIKIGRAHV